MLAASMLALPFGAQAFDWGGAGGVSSDNVSRGISESDGRPVLTLDLEAHTDTAWSANAGVAVLAGNPRRLSELSIGVGRNWQPGTDWTVGTTLTHYRYEGAGMRPRYDDDELAASLGWQGRGSASVVLSPDTQALDWSGQSHSGVVLSYELAWHQRLAGRLALDAGLGWRDLQPVSGISYAYGSLALSWGIGPVQMFLTAIGSRAGERGAAMPAYAGNRLLASALWSF